MNKQKGFIQPLSNLPKPSLWLLGTVAVALLSISVVFAIAGVLQGEGTLDSYKISGEVLFIIALGMAALLLFLFFQQRNVNKALLDSEERFRNILEHAPIGMAILSLSGQFLQVNRALCEMTGYTREELKDLKFQDITHPDDLETDLAYANELLRSQRNSYRLEKRYVRKDGSHLWIQLTGSVLRTAQGKPLYFIAQVEDISERKAAQDKMHYVAYFDPLTHLPNKRVFMDRAEQALSLARHHHRHVAVLFLALDGFRRILDQLGKEVGDEVLKQVAARLVSSLRSSDTISHIGINQFAILLPEVASAQEVNGIVPKILADLQDHLVVFGRSVEIRTNVGIAIYSAQGSDTAADLLKKAEIAMCNVRTVGRHNFTFYSAEENEGNRSGLL